MRVAVVTVSSTQGSAPRDAGARMVVTAEGYRGSIGGGALEYQAIATAQSMLKQGPALLKTSHALGPELGQCCGGRVDLVTEVFENAPPEEPAELRRFRWLCRQRRRGRLARRRHSPIRSATLTAWPTSTVSISWSIAALRCP